MARVYVRDGHWWADFQPRGGPRYRKRMDIPADTSEKEAGRAMHRLMDTREAEIKAGPAAAPESFAAYADKHYDLVYSQKAAARRYRDILDLLKATWKGHALADITAEMIDTYRAQRLKVRQPATVARELIVIRRLFRKAVAHKRIAESPAADIDTVKVSNTRVSFLDADEMRRLEAALPDWLKSIVTFARYTGARRGEIFGLRWRDVDYQRKQITFAETKSGHTQRVKMNRTTLALLKSLPRPVSRSQQVFPPVKIEKLRKAWGKACGTAKVTGFRFHDLRHQAATDLLSRGANLNDVRDFLRHSSTAMTLRYAHLVEDKREETACLLDSPELVLKSGTGEVKSG